MTTHAFEEDAAETQGLEITPEMIKAGVEVVRSLGETHHEAALVEQVYIAMLAERPRCSSAASIQGQT